MILPVPGRILAALVPLATIGCGAPAPAPPAHHPTIVSLNPCGKGIVLGWEVEQVAWEAALRTALAEPYIVQERVALPSEPYPHWDGGSVEVASRMLDTALYAANGAYVDGCLTRLSTAALLNVTAGGGSTVPTFVAEPRS